MKSIVIEESLFLGKDGENALDIFLRFFGKSTYFPEIEIQPDRMLRNVYEYLTYIDGRIREYFRKRIGLSDEENPLFEVYLLDVCLILNDYHSKGNRFTFDDIFNFDFDSPPLVLIEKYNSNLDVLKANMKKYIEVVEVDDKNGKFYFEDLSRMRRYLKFIDSTALHALVVSGRAISVRSR